MVDGQRHVEIAEQVSGMFGASVRTVKSDIRRVQRRWAREYVRGADARRLRTIRALERNAAECHAQNDREGERAALAHVAKCLGMGGPQVAVQVNQQVNTLTIGAVDVAARRSAITSAVRFLIEAGAVRPDALAAQPVDSVGADRASVGALAAR